MNPQDPATLQEGGALRLALTAFPENFNTLHIDGNTGDIVGMLKPTMPRAFIDRRGRLGRRSTTTTSPTSN